MSPAFNIPDSIESSRGSSQSPHHGLNPEEMADIEATSQDNAVRVGEEIDYFAAQLDRYDADQTGSPPERRSRAFQLVDSYYTFTRKRLDRLRERQARQRSAQRGSWQRAGSIEMDLDDADEENDDILDEELQQLEDEVQIWDLLRRILPLRYHDATQNQKKEHDGSTKSRRQWWNEFMVSDSVARERKVVLEWLQNSASYGPPIDEVVSDLQHNAERGDILAHGWLHTRHKIKLQKSVNAYQGVLDPRDAAAAQSHLSSNSLITQLDPDAVTRQARKLEPQDESFERAIWLGCFEMLRRGCSMSEIREWLAVRTELWRAFSIAPLPLSNPDDEEQPDFDPVSLILWRRMCYAIATDGGTSDYDRAVYGLLAGDIPSVEKVCKTWDDVLFAHYNALLRTQFDLFLIKHGGDAAAKAAQQFPSFNAVAYHGDPATATKRLIDSLETGMKTSAEAFRPAKALQAAIVADDLDKFLFHQGLLLSIRANKKEKSKLIPEYPFPHESFSDKKYYDLGDHQGLRILAHVLIIILTLDRLSGVAKDKGPLQARHQAAENSIAAYISYLRLVRLEEMIPLYCSKLHGPRVYSTLSRNLIHIVDIDARLHQLTIMRNLGIDVSEFVKSQPLIYLDDVQDELVSCDAKDQFKILEDGPATLKYGRLVKPDFFGDDADYVDPEDDALIRSMEWLLLVPGLFVETCAYAVRIYKYFLKRTRLRAARAFSRRVRGHEIIRTKFPNLLKDVDENDPAAWFEEFAAAQLPSDLLESCPASQEKLITITRHLWELESLVRALDSIETLTSLAALTREESVPMTREMWQEVSQTVRIAKACMRPVLKEWLLTTYDGRSVEQDFLDIRQAYIPETILAYISCLHFAGTSLSRDNLLECMDLAAIIAEKDSDVAKEFMRCGRMKELVEAFASASKALAIWSGEKKGSQTNSKKLRELGW
nr:Nup84p [Thermochaetoides thermophila]